GSCDDYYPFERALGAASFSLHACTESAILLDIRDETVLRFFKRRGNWLLSHDETGRLSNHQALSALSLYKVYLLTEKRFLEGALKRLKRVFEWQSEEGWFQEYEGCDPGYHTLTIDFLAKYYAKSKDDTVLEPLRKAIEFASYFIHPDGSYGGEYGSRNTFNFYPHGFELMGRIYPLATQITDRFLLGIKSGKRAYLEDERIFFHTVVNFLQAYIDYNDNRSGSLEERGDFVRDFDKAGIYVRSEKSSYAVISTAKGGVVKLFKNGEHLYSDNGLIARLRNFSIVVTHQVDRYETNIDKMRVEVSGQFGFIRPRFANPLKFILFRIGLLVLGRFSSNLIRGVLQRMLITGKRKAPIAFKRTFVFGD
ncbi:hypothetical protein GTO36_04240, partial [bacterium]|nr:hypothetical protein [bacterium]